MEMIKQDQPKEKTNVARLVLSISYIIEMAVVLILSMLFKFSNKLEHEFGSGVITSDFGYFVALFVVQFIFFGYFLISYGIMAYRNQTNKTTKIIFLSYFVVALVSLIIVLA